MLIQGLQKTTLLDYPGKVAATVFLQGCNMNCPFCHNRALIHLYNENCMDEEQVIKFLERRKNILDGVCITGGEPTLQPDIVEFIDRIKILGYQVKLDTNGYKPKVLRELIQLKLIDYIAMDIKAAPYHYPEVTGVEKIDIHKIQESVDLLKAGTIPYEFRTTVANGLHQIEEFDVIGEWLTGVDAYFIQNFRSFPHQVCDGLHPFPKNDLDKILEIARKYIDNVSLRGVE